ncbi:Rav2p KNAG_0A02600 [Huiozyma naganishii CBS 8797]|uniref:Uncharacterized protein n=1 Tax=Huiozyma naganishii (strain ATCC MYA-139 / BCRC 22969 / CBS 8797 / KCTC 17520 / NBRC 10181 / NCYC 3082 / Yp74L-3) TaxID=1071383 RepID=J7S230_HUIN7|nr:hypothetical protein KNAG_0A02600 [Kazachstania naganishii CBS 8797]CCK67949.1 hypothetical protein KNAG_0A02600 [Kazachstania naganishii CBS 8797]
MTTELYPYDYNGVPDTHDEIQDHSNEQRWLINEIIRPELPNIIDNVEKCVEGLYSDQTFKMPLSNSTAGNSVLGPTIKGIITRQGTNVLDFQIALSFPEFKKGKPTIYRMNTGVKFSLYQLEYIGKNLQTILELLEDLEIEEDTELFLEKFRSVLSVITQSINVLENPPKNLIFPFDNNFAMKQMFQGYGELSESNHHEISLEIVLVKNELCIDFRNLEKVTKKPWCNIDLETKKSLVDKIKEALKVDRDKTLSETLRENDVHLEEPGLITNLMISTFNRESTTLQQAQAFIARCITYNGKVVIETEKISVTTSDPTLISITSKLSSIERSISNHFTNLEVA